MRHAHGYVVQTAADLGVVGLLASVALLAGVARRDRAHARLALPGSRAAGAAAGARGLDPRVSFGPERVALATLATVVVVFGVHSFVDWTWFVPGNGRARAARRGLGRRPRAAERARRRTRGCSARGWPQGVRKPLRVAIAGGRWRSGCWRRGRVAISEHGGDVFHTARTPAGRTRVRARVARRALVLANSTGMAERACRDLGARTTRVVHLGTDCPGSAARRPRRRSSPSAT